MIIESSITTTAQIKISHLAKHWNHNHACTCSWTVYFSKTVHD